MRRLKLLPGFVMLILLCFAGFLQSCSQKRGKKFAINCANHPLELAHVEYTRFDAKGQYDELWYNQKKVVKINNENLNNGKPYTPGIYGNAPWQYFDTVAHAYRSRPNDSSALTKIRFMIYLDTANFTTREFNELAKCLEENMPSLQKVIDSNAGHYTVYQIGGLVYGNEKDFTGQYENEKNYVIQISPDGSIVHISYDRDMTITSSNGLGERVMMPGSRIAVADTNQITMKQLGNYRNKKTGRSIGTDFKLYYDIHPQSG